MTLIICMTYFYLVIRLRAPSYFCDNETATGLQLHYRSKRRGFVHYTMGQLKSIAETFYKLELSIQVLDQEIKFDTIHVSFQAREVILRIQICQKV